MGHPIDLSIPSMRVTTGRRAILSIVTSTLLVTTGENTTRVAVQPLISMVFVGHSAGNAYT